MFPVCTIEYTDIQPTDENCNTPGRKREMAVQKSDGNLSNVELICGQTEKYSKLYFTDSSLSACLPLR